MNNDTTVTCPASLQHLGLTEASLRLLDGIARNAGNWSGMPPVYDHVKTPADKGNLTDLKKKGLLTTFRSDGEEWIEPTDLFEAAYPDCF